VIVILDPFVTVEFVREFRKPQIVVRIGGKETLSLVKPLVALFGSVELIAFAVHKYPRVLLRNWLSWLPRSPGVITTAIRRRFL
jgi:hypothetical protein